MTIKIRKRGSESLRTIINTKSRERRAALREDTDLQALSVETRRNDLTPKLVIEDRSLDSLRAAKRRVRRTNAKHVKEVARSISAFGNCQPVLIDGTGTIIDGHIRWEAARQLGLENIPAIVIDHLTPDEVRALRITLGRLAENGEWEPEQLTLELLALRDLEFDLTITGFSGLELDVMLQAPAAATEADKEVPEPALDLVTVVGDLWLLGEHKLLCGDATIKDSYETLLGKERAHVSFGDGPYNLAIKGFVSGLGMRIPR